MYYFDSPQNSNKFTPEGSKIAISIVSTIVAVIVAVLRLQLNSKDLEAQNVDPILLVKSTRAYPSTSFAWIGGITKSA
jgi:hypothetical protein